MITIAGVTLGSLIFGLIYLGEGAWAVLVASPLSVAAPGGATTSPWLDMPQDEGARERKEPTLVEGISLLMKSVINR